MTNWSDDESVKAAIERMVKREFDNLNREIPEHLGGNKFRVPPAMKEWLQQNYKDFGGHSDWQYRVNVGYGRSPLIVDFYGRQDSVTMTFLAPDGTRLFILELVE